MSFAPKIETPTLVGQIIDKIDRTLKGSGAWTDNTDGTYTLNTCNTLWLHPCKQLKLTIDSVDYTVKSVVHNESLTIEGASLPTLTTFEIYTPKYFKGTVSQVQKELDKIRFSKDKYPMIYLNEGIRDTFYNNDNIADRESQLRLFFLSESDYQNNVSSEDYDPIILPMRNLAYAFFDAVENGGIALQVDQYNIIDRDKMAITTSPKGSEKKLFTDDLTGADMSITVPFLASACKNNC